MTSDIADGIASDTVDEITAPQAGAGSCCGSPQRRRGATLQDAILDAAYAELSEVGYTAFSVESVATRARTGKASIYRRWPSKQRLVLETLAEHLPGPDESRARDAGCDDSLTTAQALRVVGRRIGETLTSPLGRALRAVKLEAAADPELAALVDCRFQQPRRAALLDLLRRGVERGEVRPEAATALVADVLPAMLAHRVLLQGEQVTAADVDAVIEQVLIPLVSSDGAESAR